MTTATLLLAMPMVLVEFMETGKDIVSVHASAPMFGNTCMDMS